MSEIREYGDSASDVKICRGRYVVDPRGNVVLLPLTAPLKNGWRIATAADLAAYHAEGSEIAHVADPAVEPDSDSEPEPNRLFDSEIQDRP